MNRYRGVHGKPALIEVMWARLVAVADECWTTLRKTAFSPIITEALDIGCEVMDADGHALANASRGMPVFNLVLPNVVRACLDRFGQEGIADGDVFITNDPWLCAGHLPDIAVVTPVFHRGRLLGFIGNIANATDIGGTLARSSAREVYEEGVQIPPMKLARSGVVSDDLLELVAANVRQSEAVVADIRAQMMANVTAARRLVAFVEEYGLDDLRDLGATLRSYSEQAMRRAVADVPDGVYAADTWLDGDGEPIRLGVEVKVDGSALTVAFPDCPPQVAQGGVNVALNYTRAHTVYVLKCILAPDIPSNEGAFAPFEVVAEPGSILNAQYPASVGLRTKTGWHVHPLILKAMQPVLPYRVMAPGGFPSWLVMSGVRSDSSEFREHMVISGGLGATAYGDGQSACGYPTTTASVPVELIEQRSPILIEAKEYIEGSGGIGTWRGGLGQRVVIRMLPNADVMALTLSASLDQTNMPADGLAGGGPGRPSRMLRQGEDSEALPAAFVTLRDHDHAVVLETAGGGGYGDPSDRSAAAIQEDIADGLDHPHSNDIATR